MTFTNEHTLLTQDARDVRYEERGHANTFCGFARRPRVMILLCCCASKSIHLGLFVAGRSARDCALNAKRAKTIIDDVVGVSMGVYTVQGIDV